MRLAWDWLHVKLWKPTFISSKVSVQKGLANLFALVHTIREWCRSGSVSYYMYNQSCYFSWPRSSNLLKKSLIKIYPQDDKPYPQPHTNQFEMSIDSSSSEQDSRQTPSAGLFQLERLILNFAWKKAQMIRALTQAILKSIVRIWITEIVLAADAKNPIKLSKVVFHQVFMMIVLDNQSCLLWNNHTIFFTQRGVEMT